MEWLSYVCPMCLRNLPAEKWEDLQGQRPKGLALLWRSLGRGTLKLVRHVFRKREAIDTHLVKARLLDAVLEFRRVGIITNEDIADLLNEFEEDDDIIAYTEKKPTYHTNPSKITFLDRQTYNF